MTPLKGNPGGTILHIWYQAPFAHPAAKLSLYLLLAGALWGKKSHGTAAWFGVWMQTALTISPVLLSHKPTLHRQKMSHFIVPLPLSAACSLTGLLVLMVISLCQAMKVSFLPPILPKSTWTLTALHNTIAGAAPCPRQVFNHCSNFTSATWSETSSSSRLSLLFSSPTCASWWKARNEGKVTTPLSGLILQSS